MVIQWENKSDDKIPFNSKNNGKRSFAHETSHVSNNYCDAFVLFCRIRISDWHGRKLVQVAHSFNVVKWQWFLNWILYNTNKFQVAKNVCEQIVWLNETFDIQFIDSSCIWSEYNFAIKFPPKTTHFLFLNWNLIFFALFSVQSGLQKCINEVTRRQCSGIQ